MLRRILLWIYCLPLEQAFLLALIATGAFLWLRHRYEDHRWWRWVLIGLLLCWLAVVLGQTVVRKSSDGNDALSLLPFRCYITVLQGGEKELIRSAFMNMLLFYPGGLILRSLWKQWGTLLLIFFLGSALIELCQYGWNLGTAETDDVIHNTLGAALGLLAVSRYEKMWQPKKK